MYAQDGGRWGLPLRAKPCQQHLAVASVEHRPDPEALDVVCQQDFLGTHEAAAEQATAHGKAGPAEVV